MNYRYIDFKIKFQEFAMIAASLLVMTACGSTVNTTPISTLSQVACQGTNCAVTTPTPIDQGNIYNLPAAPSYNAQINGVAGAVPTVSYAIQTSRTLKVKITPLSAPNMTLPGYTGFVFPYGCLRMQVTVNGQTQTTGVLRVDAIASVTCSTAPTYQVLDFSNAVTGNGVTNVTISNADYDNCRAWGNTFAYGCSMSAMFANHVAAATAQIQGDGYYMSP